MRRQTLYIYIFTVGVFYLLGVLPIFQPPIAQFYFLSGALVVYNCIELYLLYQRNQDRFLLNPIVLATIANMFVFLGGITNFLLYRDGFLFNTNLYTGPFLREHPELLVRAMSYVCMAAVFMWFGYRSVLGKRLFQYYYHAFRFRRLINFWTSESKLLILVGIAYAIKIYLYQSGLYGYQQLANESYQNSRLITFQYLSVVVFLVAGYYYYAARRTPFSTVLFWSVFVLELIFALGHGARSSLINFFGLYFIIRYYSGMRVKLVHGIVGGILLFFVFSIGGAYKTFMHEGAGGSNPIASIVKFIRENKKYRDINARNIGELAYYYSVGRMNYVNETAMAIDYKDNYGLRADDPSFTYWMALSPVSAFVPTYFVMGEKEPRWGVWFNRRVQKTYKGNQTSIAFSPVGYLYFLGKIPSVCIGFLLYGIVLRFTHQLLSQRPSLGGFILFLTLFSTLYTFNTSVHSTVIWIIRYTILFPFALYFLLAKVKVY